MRRARYVPMPAERSSRPAPLEQEAFARRALQNVRLCDAATERAAVPVACREGCALCCWLRVDVFAHEVFLMAHYVRTHFSAEERAALDGRLAVHAAEVGQLTPLAHATRNVPCPLLLAGRCSIYAARPHACRRHHSRDFAACQFTFDHPEDLAAPAAHDGELFRTISALMQQDIEGYAEAGFDHTIYELGTALQEALDDPATWPRWQNGGRAFLRAAVTPAE